MKNKNYPNNKTSKPINELTKNKKAIMWNNTLSVIIAVLGLLLLTGAVYQGFYAVTNNEQKNAQSIINSLEAKIQALPAGQTTEYSVRGFQAKNTWYLAGWGLNNDDIPDKCFPKSCVCICEQQSSLQQPTSDCQNAGVCRKFEARQITIENHNLVERTIKIIRDPDAFSISPSEKITETEEEITNTIDIPNNLLKLNIEKSQDSNSLKIIKPLT